MTHPCRVPLHSISRKIINRAKSLAAELAGGLAAGSQVVLPERVCVCMCMCIFECGLLPKGMKNSNRFKGRLFSLSLSLSLSLAFIFVQKRKHANRRYIQTTWAHTSPLVHTHCKVLMRMNRVFLTDMHITVYFYLLVSVFLPPCPFCSFTLSLSLSLSVTHTHAHTHRERERQCCDQ